MKLGGVFLSILLLASHAHAKDDKMVQVLLWSEQTEPRNVYPQGISGALYDHFKSVKGFEPKMAALSDPETGVSDAVLDQTDVVIWFGHHKHTDVTDDAVERFVRLVKEKGMDLMSILSTNFSKTL